jgi:CHAT domain-containing protein
MAATRPSSAIRAGSSDSSSWWETKEFARFTDTAHTLRAAGDFVGLESVYLAGYQRAKALGHIPAQINYLTNLGTARMFSLQYASALEAYLGANRLAEELGDWSASGAIAVNLSLIYQQVGDAESALSALERGKTAVDRLPAPPRYMAQLLMRLRSVRADLEEDSGGIRYQDAIEAARRTGDPEAEASAWDLLGDQEMTTGKLEDAEAALGRALRLRSIYSRESLSFSYAGIGELRLRQADLAIGEQRRERAREAFLFTERALTAGPSDPARYMLLHQRGQIREMLGETQLALEDFSAAVDRASQWSAGVPPGQSMMTGVHVGLQHQVYESFVEAASREALRSGNPTRVADAFLALEANRAASLRESRAIAPVWKKKLPVTYWETLAKLNREDARGLGAGTISPESKRLRLVLTEMESIAGLGVSLNSSENFRTRSSLTHIQHGLGESDLLLSFFLGKRESYVWAVTKSSLDLHRLPPAGELGEEIGRFRKALLTKADSSAREQLGADLYQGLLGWLDSKEAAKTSWLVSLDGSMFDLPFAALVSGYVNGWPVYAVERHSIQGIPGAMFLNSPVVATGASGGFLGVADPVYNSADPRWKPRWKPSGPVDALSPPETVLAASGAGSPRQLNRLVSTSRELRRSSQSWQANTGSAWQIQIPPMQILEGTAASREAFLAQINSSGTRQAPLTIHLATHVLAPALQPDQGFLAFSLDTNGSPGLLSTSEIGLLHVPDALVVMTGCATATGDVRPGVGLLGLSQAWMMAGARTVLATNWPVPDADGDLIPGFYRNLRGTSAAEALRRSQIELIHSGTWQSSPSYWAAFQVIGGGR